MNYQLVVFDWDGTLMDSEARIVTCLRQAAADVGLPVPTVAESRDIIGLGLDEAMARLFPGVEASGRSRLVDAYRGHWLDDKVAPSPLFDGAVDLVNLLRDAGVLLAVATGKSRRGLDRALDDCGLRDLFDVTRCADETRSKPHPQMLEEILTDLDTAPAAALMVGDTEYDMRMAQGIGVPAVGIEHGVHTRERLIEHGAVACVANLFEFSDWVGLPLMKQHGSERYGEN